MVGVASLSTLLFISPAMAFASFQDLGTLPGGDYFLSRAQGISGDGNIVVGSGSIVTNGDWVTVVDEQAIRWDAGVLSSMKSLVAGHDRSVAKGVSYDGSVVAGVVYRWDTYVDGGFIWTNGTFSLLGDFPGGSTWSNGNSVSDDGTVIVGHSVDAVNDHAMEWVSGTLNNLFMGAQWNYAQAVSGDGMTIAGFDEHMGAVRWDSGVPTTLTPPPAAFFSRAYGISADGLTVVGYSLTLAADIATRWDGGTASLIGALPGNLASRALDASGEGEVIVGYSRDDQGTRTATIWLPYVGVQSLYGVLDVAGEPVAGWTLREVTAVSDDGLTVVGYGINPSGYERGFVATLPAPEPSFGIGLGLGAAFLGRVARSQRRR